MFDGDLSERPPTADEAKRASTAMAVLARAFRDGEAAPVAMRARDDETVVELPPALTRLLLDVLGHIARGEMVTLVPYEAVLSTKKAADLLNVSRPFLISLLDKGKIPYWRTGSHRRIRVSDLLDYKRARDAERGEALDALQDLGREFDRE